MTVGRGDTGTRVAVGGSCRLVGVTGTINAVGEGDGLGVAVGVRVVVGDSMAVGVESGTATVTVANVGTRRVDVGSAATWPGVGVESGLDKRVGVANGLTGAVAVGFGPGGTAHAASIKPSHKSAR
jgi:urease beta subunit